LLQLAFRISEEFVYQLLSDFTIMSTVNNQGMTAYRAPSLLQPHRARDALADAHPGKIAPLIGLWHDVSSPTIVRITAQLGFDVLCLDWEHSACNIETMTQLSAGEISLKW
jgi:4-hydroxy-2-oxoheptanedioate aldolase